MVQELRYTDKESRSELYDEVVEKLNRLAEKEGNDSASRAFAEAMATRFGKVWTEAKKVRRTEGKECVHRLLGKQRCPEQGGNVECVPPGNDHNTLWIKKMEGYKQRRPYAFVTQPYGLSFETLQELLDFCERYGLRVDISAFSWYFPTRTLLVILKKEDSYSSLKEGWYW